MPTLDQGGTRKAYGLAGHSKGGVHQLIHTHTYTNRIDKTKLTRNDNIRMAHSQKEHLQCIAASHRLINILPFTRQAFVSSPAQLPPPEQRMGIVSRLTPNFLSSDFLLKQRSHLTRETIQISMLVKSVNQLLQPSFRYERSGRSHDRNCIRPCQ